LAGSVGWLSLTAFRTWRFRRLLRHARPASEALRDQVGRLARKLGLARCPEVLVVHGRVSPMLWAVGGGPRLLLPAGALARLLAAGLLARLGQEERATLLAHELAHLRRRDHWVRWLELLATGLYWWHPVVWWARRELREAEEQCCDAWVVWALPRSARSYATALLECVDFLSDAPVPLPVGARSEEHTSELQSLTNLVCRLLLA